jgi:hypothetical protein
VATRPFWVRLFISLGTSLAIVLAAPLRADALDGQFEVRSAFINISDDVFLLHADVQYPLSDDMRKALADGASLDFDLQAAVFRERRYWFDNDVVNLTLRRQLSFHSVSNRYIVKEAGREEQRSFATVEAALEDLGKVEGWPILTRPQLPAEANYRVAVRASVRRGKLNDALRVILFWTDDWQRSSEWYEWSLLR